MMPRVYGPESRERACLPLTPSLSLKGRGRKVSTSCPLLHVRLYDFAGGPSLSRSAMPVSAMGGRSGNSATRLNFPPIAWT